ncbi:hypothetical protein GE061_003632 [Apolygus lucorum]|uniref:Uncharacterized protein n=1 Tax=Apolygus lucorum TaxID=248454 RepID=A0A8S9X404_APOLU|nr:hypothetical protein GE061_003632 [Apolygus lucorum]
MATRRNLQGHKKRKEEEEAEFTLEYLLRLSKWTQPHIRQNYIEDYPKFLRRTIIKDPGVCHLYFCLGLKPISSDSKESKNVADSQRRILSARLGGGSSTHVVLDDKYIDQSCMPAECWRMLMEGCLDLPLHFHVPGDYFQVEAGVQIQRTSNNPQGKSNAYSTTSFPLSLLVPDGNVSLCANWNKCRTSPQYDVVLSNGEAMMDSGSKVEAVSSMLGCDLRSFEYGKRYGLMTKFGLDVRHMALKAYLLLLQTCADQTFSDAEFFTSRTSVVVKNASAQQILKAAIDYELLVDCTSMPDDQVKVLCLLVGNWPCCEYVTEDSRDIYSVCLMRAEDAFLYTTNGVELKVVVDAEFLSAGRLLESTLQLFESLGAIDQLMEVFRDSKGLASFLGYAVSQPGVGNLNLVLAYPLSHGASKLAKAKKGVCHLVQIAQFISSSAHLLLDMAMGAQAFNRVHGLVERMGLASTDFFGSMEEKRVEGLLVDHSYGFEGHKNTFLKDAAPWIKCVASSGDLAKKWLLAHAKSMREYLVDNSRPSIFRSPITPLLIHDLKPIPLTSGELVKKERYIDPKGMTSGYIELEQLESARSGLLWLEALGFGESTFSVAGLSRSGETELPAIDSVLKKNVQALEGVYTPVKCTLAVRNLVRRRNYVKSSAVDKVTRKPAPKFIGPRRVVERNGRNVYELQDLDGMPDGRWHVKDLFLDQTLDGGILESDDRETESNVGEE